MTVLTTRSKEAIKTALAMAIAYGIALSMDWDRPYWAGFAVAFISLATVGQSLNKGAMRMLGTLVAAGVALTIIALSAQDRWLFMLYLSAWIGFCTYMMGGPKRQYFWNVCGFVCAIICLDAGPDPVNAFQTAVLRAEETGLGILVYSLVAVLIWPSNSRADFDAATCKLASTQHQLYRAYLGLMKDGGGAEEAQGLRAEVVQAQTRFNQLLDAAETDSYEVWDVRQPWRCYRRQVAELAHTMERWRSAFAELQALDLQRLLPNLAAFGAELDLRFAQIERMLANEALERQPVIIDLPIDEAAVRALSHFDKAALAVTQTHLQHLETLTRSLFYVVCDIQDLGQAATEADTAPSQRAGFMPDPDRITSVVRIMATLWLAYLALIYVNDIPGGTGFVTFAAALGMAMATMPQLSVTLLFVPAAGSVLFAGLVYIFVMPKLSSFAELGALIFAATFAFCYLFYAPRQALGRALGLALFVVIIGVANQQSYNFLSVADTALMVTLIFLLLAITAHIPYSPLPERAFLRLSGRFFRSGECLITTLRRDPQRPPTRLERWKQAFHEREVATLPTKLGVWARIIDTKARPGTAPGQAQAMVTNLQALSYRMQELLEASGDPKARLLVRELLAEVGVWRLAVQRTFQQLSINPASGEREAFRGRLDGFLDQLEERIKEALAAAPEGQLNDQDAENFYRLLGAFRGVSEVLIDYAASAGDIDWARWREERFA
jgi:uncharacterized membrane protein YccC